jgi:hypothetical protein
MRAHSVLFALLCSAAPASNAREARETIVDYFLALPVDHHFGPFAEGKAERRAEIAEVDHRHSYLRLRGERADGAEMRLFRMADGTVLIGQGYTGCCCEGTCLRMIRFLAARNGRFEDITSEVWPKDERAMREKAARRLLPRGEPWERSDLVEQAVYRLSRTRATVRIETGWLRAGKLLLTCRLTGKRFVCR